MNVKVTLNDADLKAGISALRKKFPYAVKRALARTTTTTKAAMAQAMREDTYLSSRFIKQEIKVEYAEGAARLVVQGNRVPLIAFSARGPEPSRGKGRGVSYRLPGGRSRAPHAFIATMSSGHRGVFERRGAGRTPIRELRGPSLVNVFAKFLGLGADTANEALLKNLRHEISFALSQVAPSSGGSEMPNFR